MRRNRWRERGDESSPYVVTFYPMKTHRLLVTVKTNAKKRDAKELVRSALSGRCKFTVTEFRAPKKAPAYMVFDTSSPAP